MPMKVPAAIEREVVQSIIASAMKLRLYGNDKTPAAGDTVAGYTEIVGGGYANKPLILADWTLTIAGVSPTVGTYLTQTWVLTGPLDPPNTIYGYYVTRDSDGKLMWAERFPSGVLPFAPVNGSKIVVQPRFSAASLF